MKFLRSSNFALVAAAVFTATLSTAALSTPAPSTKAVAGKKILVAFGAYSIRETAVVELIINHHPIQGEEPRRPEHNLDSVNTII